MKGKGERFRRAVRRAMSALLSVGVAACNCNPPLRISPVQRDDKKLDCKAIILEMNEAEYYRTLAKLSAKKSVTKVYAPLCMLWGATDSLAAYENAGERLEYLSSIYNFLDCGGASAPAVGGKASGVPLASAPVAPVKIAAPPAPPSAPAAAPSKPPTPPQGAVPGYYPPPYGCGCCGYPCPPGDPYPGGRAAPVAPKVY